MQHERGDRTARRASVEHPPSGPLAAASYLIRARGTDRVVIEVSVGTQVLLLSQPTGGAPPIGALGPLPPWRRGAPCPSSGPNPIASPPALCWDLRLSSGPGRGGPKRYD